MSAALDIVLPIVARDAFRLRTLGASLRKFWRVPGTLRLFTPERCREEIAAAAREHLDGPLPVEIITDEELLARPAKQPAYNWYQQQLVKLCAHTRVASDFYLVLDADCFAVRPIEHGDLVIGGRGAVAMHTTDVFQPGWYRASLEVLQLPPDTVPTRFVNVTPFVMSKALAAALGARLAELHGPTWPGVLLMRAGPTELGRLPWTEYTLYYLHARAAGLWDKFHVEAPPIVGNAVWFGSEIETWDPRKSFEPSPSFCFSLVQSNMRLPDAWVWERVAPFLSGS
jgi:hypothetical protein